MVAELETEAAQRHAGLVDAHAETLATEARRPIMGHLVDYRAKLETAGRTVRHIDETIGYVERVVRATGIESLPDLTSTRVERYTALLARHGKSARTVQATLAALQAFRRWLVTIGKLSRDRLASIQKPNPEAAQASPAHVAP